MKPSPTSEQAVRILEILERWNARSWWYDCSGHHEGSTLVSFSNPADDDNEQSCRGVNHLDALAQATSVMQVLLEEHPENP